MRANLRRDPDGEMNLKGWKIGHTMTVLPDPESREKRKEGVRKGEQERSPEERIKALQEKAAQLEKRLKELEEVYKRISSPQGRTKQMREDIGHYEKRLKQLRDVLELVKKGEITPEEVRERLEKLLPRKQEDR